MLGWIPKAPSLARLAATATVALLVVLAGASGASAHPILIQSNPTPGLVAPKAPSFIVLSFSEPIAQSRSAVRVKRVGGGDVRTGGPTSSTGGATVTIPLKDALAAGVYEARWSVVGTDGHQIAGRFRFGVANPDGTLPRDVEKLGADTGNRLGTTIEVDIEYIAVYVKWTALLAAALMLGGGLLARSLRRHRTEVPQGWAIRVSAAAWILALLTEVQHTMATAGLDLGLLISTWTGGLALVRIIVLLLVGGAAFKLRSLGIFAAAGAGSLATHALDGHTAALTSDRALAWLESVMHVEAAAAWTGGLLCVVLWSRLGRVPIRALIQAFTPTALVCTALLAISGILIAVREVDRWMFLRWTDYGQVVSLKVLLLVCALTIALWHLLGSRRRQKPPVNPEPGEHIQSQSSPQGRGRLIRVEAAIAATIVLLAAVLTSLVPGIGLPTFAQRGNLLTGAVMASAATTDAVLQLAVAPARRGENTVTAIPTSLREGIPVIQPKSISVRLACECSKRDRTVQLRQTAPGVWSTRVHLPRSGSWLAHVQANGHRAIAPVSVPIEDPDEGGPQPLVVQSTADLSGESAERCRAFAQGLAIGVGRLNAGGGVDGGRKVVLQVADDAGFPSRAKMLTHDAHPDVVTPCGSGAAGALESSWHTLALLGDVTANVVEQRGRQQDSRVFRIALDPYAEGFGIGQYLAQVEPTIRGTTLRRVGIVVDGPDGAQRLAGLRSSLAGTKIAVEQFPANAAENAASLRRIADPDRYLTTLVDGDARLVSVSLRRLGEDGFVPSALIASPHLATEPFMLAAGTLGRQGAVRIPSEVLPDSADGQAYATAVGRIFLGAPARIAGLRGYVTGLTLAEATRDGTSPERMTRRLLRPHRYTDALSVPWRQDAPSLGAQGFALYAPTFLPATLVPESMGGMSYSGTFFRKGEWSRISPTAYGPSPSRPITTR